MTESMLLRHPRPLQHESFLGYLLRLSNKNGYERINPLLQFGEYKGRAAESLLIRLFNQQLSFKFIDNLTGFYEGTLASFFEQYGKEDRRFFCVHRPRVCPVCISENSTTHTFVDISAQVVCPRHGIVLINYCTACRQKITWYRKRLDRCDCGFKYRESELIIPCRLTLALFEKWGVFIDYEHQARDKSDNQAYQLARCLLRPTDCLQADIDWEYLPVEYLYSALEQACLLLERTDFLKELSSMSVRIQKTRLPFLKPTTALKSWILGKYDSLDSVKDGAPFVNKTGLYFPAAVFDTDFRSLSSKEKADQFLVSHRRFIATVTKNAKAQENVSDALSSQADIPNLAKALCLDIESVQSLQSIDWITPINRSHKKRNEWLYNLSDANRKLAVLYKNAEPINPTKDYIVLSDRIALRTLGTDIGSILKSEIKIYSHTTQRAFDGLFVKEAYFEKRIITRLINDHILSLEEAAQELKTTKTVVCILNRNRAIAGYGDGLGEKLNQVSATALSKFQEQYILLNSIAAENRIRPSTIAKKLLTAGFKPDKRFEHGTGAIFLYGISSKLITEIDSILKTNKGRSDNSSQKLT